MLKENRKPIKLDIGGGTYKRGDEYTSVDIQNADVIATMWELPFKDNSVDEIWSSHTLEHAPMGRVSVTLKEWLRVLKLNARAIISVPNFDYVAKYWLTGEDRGWAEAMVFGHQANDGEFHKCAFTGALLRADLEGAGFVVKRIELRWSHSQETLQAVCIKPNGKMQENKKQSVEK
jgi:predicted SAM-dependent methyltransferase